MSACAISKRTALAALAAAFVPGALRCQEAARALDAITPERFGARGDGVTVDTAAINKALAYLARRKGAELRFRNATYLIDAPLDGASLEDVRLVGPGTLKALGGTDFQFLLSVAKSRNVTIESLTFDANKAARMTARGRLSCVDANGSTACRMLGCTFKNTLGVVAKRGASSVAVAASGGCTGLLVHRCQILDCGATADFRPSDGIFVRGDDCLISECFAENVTDHGFVLEGCNRSRILDCSGRNCTSIAGMSNDGVADVGDNEIAGITGTCSHLGSFGGMIGAYAFGQGRLLRSVIHNVDVRLADDAAGHGAGMFLYGRIEGLTVEEISIDAGTTSGVMNHALVIDGVLSATIRNSRFRADRIGSCVRMLHASSGVILEGNQLVNGAHGVYADGAAVFVERGNRFIDCRATITLAQRASYRRAPAGS